VRESNLTPEVDEGPIDHIKSSNASKRTILEHLLERKAFDEESAIEETELKTSKYDMYALNELVVEEKIHSDIRGEVAYYYLDEYFKPVKSYRKEVVMGLSIPILIFLVSIILAGMIAIIVMFFR
jgi:hypothetical protein